MRLQPFKTFRRAVFALCLFSAMFALPAHAAPQSCNSGNLPTGPTAYVATAPNLVSVLDASTSPNAAVACTISVGAHPTNLAVSPDGSTLFVENDTDASISVVDLNSGNVTNTIALTATGVTAPFSANLAVSPDGKYVYVISLPQTLSSTTQASLSVINLASMTVSGAMPLSTSTPTPVTGPGLGVSFSPDATKAYLSTDGVTYVAAGGANPFVSAAIVVNGGTIALGPKGNVAYVLRDASGTNAISQITTGTNAVANFGLSTQCSQANSSAITPDGSFVYSTCAGNNSVQAINTSTNTVAATISLASSGPQGIAITSDGKSAYVANRDGSISVIAIATNELAATIPGSSALNGIAFRPVQLAISPATQNMRARSNQQFASVLKFAFGGVAWSVSCTSGVAACGTVDPSGLYTAPGTVPVPNDVVVAATSSEIPLDSLLYPSQGVSAPITLTTPTTVVTITSTFTSVKIEDLPAGTDTFTATVNDPAPSLGVTWDIFSCAAGAINLCGSVNPATGAYTPPVKVPVVPNNSFVIRATANVDNETSATQTITITSTITVTNIAPTTVKIEDLPAGTDTFTATVTGDPNPPPNLGLGVTWAMLSCAAGTPSLCGTINATTGAYTPPAKVPAIPNNTFLVQATSVADPSKTSAPVLVTITSNITITNITPITVKIEDLPAGTDTFTATVTGDPNPPPNLGLGVTWVMLSCAAGAPASGLCGTINPTTGAYTPPTKEPAAPNNTFVVQATSVTDPSKTSAPVTVTITSNITVTINPTFANPTRPITPVFIGDLPAGFDTFTATVTGDPNPPPNLGLGVTWAIVSCAAGAPNLCGTIDANTGAYTPPVKVPPVPTNTFVVQATSVTDTSKTSTPVTITILSNITVTINPTFANPTRPITPVLIEDLPAGFDTFTATVTGDPNPPPGLGLGVTWAIVSCAAGTPGLCGTINATTGAYTPPAKVPSLLTNTFTVQATSVADPSKASAPVTIAIQSNITVTINPTFANPTRPNTPVFIEDLPAGFDTFTATVTNDPNPPPNLGLGVTWAMISCAAGTPSLCGSINSTTGAYTPPIKVPLAPGNSFVIQATSVADPSKTSPTVTITISSNITLTVSQSATPPNTSPLAIRFTDNLIATVLKDPNSPGLNVTWTASAGTIVPGVCTTTATSEVCSAVYTAPGPVAGTAAGLSVTITATPVADPNKNSTNNNGPAFTLLVKQSVLVFDPAAANPTTISITSASGQTSGSTVLDLQGPVTSDGTVFQFSCSDFGGLKNAVCFFSGAGGSVVTANGVATPGVTGTTPVTLTLSVQAAPTSANSRLLLPSHPSSDIYRGLALVLVISSALLALALCRRLGMSLPKPRQAFALVLLLGIVLGWASACTQFSQPAFPQPPAGGTPAANGALTITAVPIGGTITGTTTFTVPFSVH